MEIAADAKEYYPAKHITFALSREKLLHNFNVRLHDVAMNRLQELDVNVVLGESPSVEARHAGGVKMRNGETIPCDFLVR